MNWDDHVVTYESKRYFLYRLFCSIGLYIWFSATLDWQSEKLSLIRLFEHLYHLFCSNGYNIGFSATLYWQSKRNSLIRLFEREFYIYYSNYWISFQLINQFLSTNLFPSCLYDNYKEMDLNTYSSLDKTTTKKHRQRISTLCHKNNFLKKNFSYVYPFNSKTTSSR